MEPLEYLKKIEEFGFEAYIVGGYVRDYILGIISTDIDITTSATPKDLESIFGVKANYGGIKIDDGKYHIDITTYRCESSYFKHIPKKIKYIKDLKRDLVRRDFTMNAICMNSNSEIIDFLNGQKDINDKYIKVIGNINKKFSEDPLRMIRALRFMITYNFKLEDKALTFILKHKNLLSRVSLTRKKEEIERILTSENANEGLKFLNNMNLLTSLGISYNRPLVKTNILGMWAELDFVEDFPFTKDEKEYINSVKALIKKGKIDAFDIYKYGIDIVTTAGEIIGIKKSIINKIYQTMNIKKHEKLALDGYEIMDTIKCDKNSIKKIKEDLIYQLLSGNLSNDKNALKRYIKEYWK